MRRIDSERFIGYRWRPGIPSAISRSHSSVATSTPMDTTSSGLSAAVKRSSIGAGITLPFMFAIRCTPAALITGNTLGITGVVHPSAASSSRSRICSSARNENCVIAKSAMANLSASRCRSVARSGERGCTSGWAATPTQKFAGWARTTSMRSVAYVKSPPGSLPSAGGSPPNARMFSMPLLA